VRSKVNKRYTRRNSKLTGWRLFGIYALLLVIAVPFLFPTWWMFTASLKPIEEVFSFPASLIPNDFQISNYAEVFRLQPFLRQYWNSMSIAIVVTIISVTISTMGGYAFARISFKWRSKMFIVLLSALLMPAEVTLIPIFRLMVKSGLSDSFFPIILIPAFGAHAVVGLFLMRQFFLDFPAELEEAAEIDGLSRWRVFTKIALPLSGPALASLAIISFLYSWNLFLEPLVFLTEPDKYTLPVVLPQFTDTYGAPIFNVQLAATSLSVIPVMIVFVMAQRHFIRGITMTGIKS
jgi:multiple sugar transport system permease protein